VGRGANCERPVADLESAPRGGSAGRAGSGLRGRWAFVAGIWRIDRGAGHQGRRVQAEERQALIGRRRALQDLINAQTARQPGSMRAVDGPDVLTVGDEQAEDAVHEHWQRVYGRSRLLLVARGQRSHLERMVVQPLGRCK